MISEPYLKPRKKKYSPPNRDRVKKRDTVLFYFKNSSCLGKTHKVFFLVVGPLREEGGGNPPDH